MAGIHPPILTERARAALRRLSDGAPRLERDIATLTKVVEVVEAQLRAQYALEMARMPSSD